MRHTTLRFLILLYIVLPAAKCSAQTPQEAPHIPAFDQIFKQSTGKNGYEELVAAGDMLYNNAALAEAQGPEATLTAKRRALADPDLQNALTLLRAGLDKQITTPRDPGEITGGLPELRPFLALAHLLLIEQYVALADGQTDRAIGDLSDCLRFGYAARCQHLPISDAIGMAIDQMAIEQTVRHLDQFSDHDCNSLMTLVGEWNGVEQSPIPALSNEQNHRLQELNKIRKDPGSILQGLIAEADAGTDLTTVKLVEGLGGDPNAVVRAADAAEAMFRAVR